MTKVKTITLALAAFALAVAFNVWLDAGCSTSGVITAHGRVCV